MLRVDDAGKLREEQAALWNGSSGEAWIAAQSVLDDLFRPVEAMLAGTAASLAATSVLDVGCGTGATTIALARRLGPSATCTGVDVSAPMIDVARRRAAGSSPRPRFVCADASTHPFEPGAFDVLTSRFGVMFFGDPVAAFANLHHATAPGGALRAVVWRGPEDNPFMATAAAAAADVLPEGALPQRAPGAPGQFAFADPDRVHAILDGGGWRDHDLEAVDIPCVMPAADLPGYVSRLGPLSLALRGLDDDARARTLEVVLPAFDRFTEGDVVHVDLGCWVVGATA
jgi:SAM-dependent methyltransferase